MTPDTPAPVGQREATLRELIAVAASDLKHRQDMLAALDNRAVAALAGAGVIFAAAAKGVSDGGPHPSLLRVGALVVSTLTLLPATWALLWRYTPGLDVLRLVTRAVPTSDASEMLRLVLDAHLDTSDEARTAFARKRHRLAIAFVALTFAAGLTGVAIVLG